MHLQTKMEEGIAELEKLLTTAVSQLHQFCKENAKTSAGTFDLEGKITLKADSCATVKFETDDQGLKGELTEDIYTTGV